MKFEQVGEYNARVKMRVSVQMSVQVCSDCRSDFLSSLKSKRSDHHRSTSTITLIQPSS